MKKCLIALSACTLMASWAALANDAKTGNVVVTFTGEVVETPCVITVGNANTIDLGQVKNLANQKGAITPIPFRFSQCQAFNNVEVSWATATTGKLEEGRLITQMKHVYIDFFRDIHATQKADNSAVVEQITADAPNEVEEVPEVFMFTPMYARLTTDENNAPDQVGTVTSAVTFKVDFK